MPAATNDGPSVALSFANNFWGKDDAGVGPLLDRMHGAKQTCDELRAFYSARSSIEDEYARKLLSLCRKSLGSQETGSLKNSLDTVRGEVESMAKQHQSIATQMKSELEEPLAAFAGAMKERRKIVQNGIEKLLKVKVQQTQHVNKTRDRYEQECLKIKGYLAQGHMVMGQEERKNKAKLEKTQINLATSNTEYENAVKVLEETTARWNREWKAASDKFQDLEEERLDFTKSSLWTFANIASTVCVSDDASCEKIRLSLEKLDVEKDIITFIKDRGTGQEIPDPPKYINFCRGDADSQSETSEDENYSVAQFPRSINPAFRSSSPQPSTFESHHDPTSALARDLGHGGPGTPPSREQTLTPQTQKIAPPAAERHLVERQPAERQVRQERHERQEQAKIPYDPQEFAPVPHDPYPMDGMTMLCRTKPTNSDLGSQLGSQVGLPFSSVVSSQVSSHVSSQVSSQLSSSTRPSSRDSQEDDYSDLNTYSSREVQPPTSKASPFPTKQQQQQEAAVLPPEKGVLKKKSGFFQNHSPFRRKSTREIQGNPPHRNTWHHSNTSQSTRAPVTYGGGHEASQNQLAATARSPSPDPIDANASLALNVGQNVFAVSNPGRQRKDAAQSDDGPEDDPIALALAELKGVTVGKKQSSVRVSADHYHGIATPAPGAQSAAAAASPFSRSVPAPRGAGNDVISAAMRGTPPPSYDQQVQRLGVPSPAVTSKAMKEASQKYVTQTRSMFSPNAASGSGGGSSVYGTPSRPGTRGGGDVPRAASPAPPRSASPRPGSGADPQRHHRSASPNPYGGSLNHRSASPNPYGGSQNHRSASPNPYSGSQRSSHHQRQPSQMSARTTPNNRGSDQGYYRHNSPNDMARNSSPSPYSRNEYSSVSSRPGSRAAGHVDMAVQLAPGPEEGGGGGGYGSMRGRGGRPESAMGASRGMSLYEGAGPVQAASRARSKSVADPTRQYTRDGRAIMHFARALYIYQAAIPEELGFGKGDVLAVLRHQDDGWWEAEIHGGNGQVGLVPSNYLQPC